MAGRGISLSVEDGDHFDESQNLGAVGGQPPNTADDHTMETSRHRTKTDKGRLFALETMSKQLTSQFGKLMSDSDNINQLIANRDSKSDITDKYSAWLNMYEQYLQLTDTYNQMMGDDTSHIEIQRTRDIYLRNFKSSVENYFLSMQPDPQPLVTGHSSEQGGNTVVKKKSRSHRTTSVRSGKSSLASSISVAKLKEEQKKAELSVKMSTFSQRENIELAKVKLKLQEEQYQLTTDFAVANARSKVLEQYENIDDIGESSSQVESNVMDSNMNMSPVKHVNKYVLNPHVQPFVSETHTQPVFSDSPVQLLSHAGVKQTDSVHQTNVTGAAAGNNHSPQQPSQNDIMLSMVRYLNKPSSDIKKFDGNPREYRKFRRQFSAKIEANTDNPEERMNFLEQFTLGEANKVVSGYSHLSGEQGYPAAMRELDDRYGNSDIIANAFIKTALDWPQLKNGDAKALDDLSIFLVECENGVECVEALKILEYPDNIRKLVAKLPFYLHDRWRNIVHTTRVNNQPIQFRHLVKFIRDEAKKATDPLYGKEALVSEQKETHGKTLKRPVLNRTKGSFATTMVSPGQTESSSGNQRHTPDVQLPNKQKCTFCDNCSHGLDTCRKFVSLPVEDRYNHLKAKGHCFGCLKRGHLKNECKSKVTCSSCNKHHPTALHDEKRSVKIESQDQKERPSNSLTDITTSACVDHIPRLCNDTGTGEVTCSMAIIPVRVKLRNKTSSILTYAFFDSGSSASFCTESLLRKLGGHGKKMEVTLNTMGQPYSMQTYAVNGLQVCDMDNVNTIDMPRVYTKRNMPVMRQHIPTQEHINHWPHLKNINLPDINTEIGLMIGNNVPDAFSPMEIRTGPRGSPHATRTLLGWVIWNLIHSNKDSRKPALSSDLLVNRVEVNALECMEDTKRLEKMVEQAINFDFPEKLIDDKREYSREDKQFLEQVENSVKMENGHYCIDLPFRNRNVTLPNNMSQALHRLKSLKSKMMKNPVFKEDYTDFMEKLLTSSYAERVPELDLGRNDGRVWFLPHHGVYHPRKPGKIRVVFDCSATYMGVSLNNQLLSGPDLTNGLLGVLLRFREEKIAFIGDVESMFYQVNVPPKDTDCLRFLWWPNGNIQCEPVQYRMVVHLFGAISSPSCSNFALKKTAKDNETKFDAEVVQMVNRDMYVDDCLSSAATVEQASSRIKDVSELCAKGGFHLTKWMSNTHEVLETVPEQDRAKEIRQLDLKISDLPNERALGVYWFTQTDSLGFKIELKDRPTTRRGILATVSSVFDPLGFGAPFVLSAKSLLQELCKQKMAWDQELTGKQVQVWKEWLSQIPEIEKLVVSRCFKPLDFGDLKSCQLHTFADASQTGYGVSAYLRLLDNNGRTHCSFIMGKSRVAPLKQITIPRMELTAAVIAVRLSNFVVKELSYHVDETFFWTDSMSVIRYIRNKNCRFHTFVANRLAVIQDATDERQWKFVDTKQNPADIASRGSSATKLLQNKQWLNGPDFLWKPVSEWPRVETRQVTIPEDDVEVKTVLSTATVESTPVHATDRLLSHFSSWMKLKRTTAWILMGFDNLQNRINRKKSITETIAQTESDPVKQKQMVDDHLAGINRDVLSCAKKDVKSAMLTLSYVQKAENALIRYTQGEFSEELKVLQNKCSSQKLKRASPLYKLDPFVKDGILRVGGRLERAELSFDAMHPIILPKASPVSQMILDEIHRTIGHLGKLSILSELRQKYWVIGATAAIKKLTSKCVVCRKYQGPIGIQKMASLPKERLLSDEPPFTHVGMDFFGPFLVKRARSVVKRYGVIFTCMSIRAVHLEVADSMDTSSCINAIRRFIARRGPVKSMRTDNGTNLVGAEKELRHEIEQWNSKQINDFMLQKNIDWEFNPPGASHFGGVWERLIRSTRKILYSLMKEQVIRLDDEALRTLFCEVESVLNNRPLTELSSNPDDPMMLTPSHLLLLRQGESFPPGTFDKTDSYANRRWRQVQFLANTFWTRWIKEYLPLLQQRQKWTTSCRNLALGDVVLVVDNNPRNSWAMGRIVEVFSDKRGFVRSAKVKTVSTTLHRPVDKLCLVLEADI